MDRIEVLRKEAIKRRMELLQLIYDAKGGHTGGALSSVDIITVLHYEVMRIDSQNPKKKDRDRFVLSKGHSVEGYYPVLADLGFFSREELKTYGKYGSRLIGHPTMKVPGIEMNTGALGHGLPVAVGMALAGKMDKQDYKVYVLMGDGEQDEGSVWEAAMAGGHYGLDNLIGIIDRNKLQISGNTEKVMKLESLNEKWKSFGWEILEVDGHNVQQLVHTFGKLPVVPGKPHLIIADTVKGKGVPFMENVAKWHHGVPSAEQLELALRELDSQLKEIR